MVKSPDVLGVYPEKLHTNALPERRYLKTIRLLAVVTLITVSVLFMFAGFFIYSTTHADVSLINNRGSQIYTMDVEKKRLVPVEPYNTALGNLQLVLESNIRDYIKKRHTIVWDDNTMVSNWGNGSWVRGVSAGDVGEYFSNEANYSLNASRAQRFVQDVHVLELEQLSGSLWEGIIDLYQMPVPDAFNPLCDCDDNSAVCLNCKNLNSLGHSRFKLLIRADLRGNQVLLNPYGFRVYSYNILYMPVDPTQPTWDLPRVLQPDL